MLRIHFTAEDVGRVRVQSQPDPMWETVLSIFRLQDRGLPLVFHEWRRTAALTCSRDDLAMLRPLIHGGYFPDFLTPQRGPARAGRRHRGAAQHAPLTSPHRGRHSG
nr:hypothetical protein GCM10020092_079350 [Actinoplanes digitatis]